MKKSITILLSGLCLFSVSLVGCNSDNSSSVESSEQIQYHTVTFDSNGGSPVASQQIAHGEKIAKPNDPTRRGYEFNNWTYQGVEWSFLDNVVNEDITLVADWTIIEYTISYTLDGGTNNPANPTSYTIEDSVTFLDATKTGYDFLGWFAVSGERVTSFEPGSTGDISLTAHWNEGNTYVVTLDSDGGSGVPASINVQYNHSYELPTPRKTGYSFDGWFDGSAKINNSGTWEYASNKTFVAHWTIVEYSISYTLNGGTNNPNNPSSYTVEDGVTFLDPSKTGYTFLGWFAISGEKVTSFAPGSTGDISLTARWNALNYEITYVSEHGNNSGNPATYTIEDAITLQDASADGYTFLGWFDNNDNQVTSIPVGSTGNLTLTAHWNDGDEYTISLDAGDGNVSPTSIAVQYDHEYELPTPTFQNYGFDGWYAGDDLIPSTGTWQYTNITTLTAKWHATYEIVDGVLTITDKTIKNFVVPDGVTSIGNNAFSNCTLLESVTIPNSVTSIGDSAFSGCYALTSIDIPNGVTSIGSKTFYNCYALESVTIPSSVTSIGMNAFYDCESLDSISIPSGVTSIGIYAFSGCSSLTTISIPNGVTSIGSGTFSSCSSLASITIPSNVVSIGYAAFSYCSSLSSIVIPNAVTSLGESAFLNCYSLSSAILSDNLTSIPNFCFSGCSLLESITIPSGITSIGNYAFSGCSKLKEVTNKSSLDIVAGSTDNGYVAYYADFVITDRTDKKQCVDKDGFVTDINDRTTLIGYVGTNTEITIPSYIRSIKNNALAYNTDITSLTIPGTVNTVGQLAFYRCTSLETVVIEEGVTTLGDNVFGTCISLRSISIPNSITSFGDCLVDGCPDLVYYTDGNAKYLGNSNNQFLMMYAVLDNTITYFSIPNGCKYLYSDAFSGCTQLTSVTFPSTFISMANFVFENCSALESIYLPATIDHIGWTVFRGCSSLTIYCEASSKPAGWDDYWNPDNRPVVWGV